MSECDIKKLRYEDDLWGCCVHIYTANFSTEYVSFILVYISLIWKIATVAAVTSVGPVTAALKALAAAVGVRFLWLPCFYVVEARWQGGNPCRRSVSG